MLERSGLENRRQASLACCCDPRRLRGVSAYRRDPPARMNEGPLAMVMHDVYRTTGFAARAAAVAPALLVALAVTAAEAHHPMGGVTPTTFAHGLLSGLGHPVIGLDHLAFILAMGIAVGAAGLSLALPAAFVVLSVLGVAMHVAGMDLPAAEFAIALSVLAIGAAVAWGGALPAAVWALLFAVAGLVHGYAFGETVVGAEPMPIAAYLVGLAVVQSAIAVAAALVTRRMTSAMAPRIAGAAVAVLGIAILAGQFMPA
jgi:urease accessory protein